ncbi:MAG TPA: Glu/Leu/Phe/Val dehydrogenase dimerization domain-containing protein [Ktedonobacterales bacterium]|nr:Glu/Leu/Phe/Val dehydrogenase dimerization domain-containing protein [Ktedonobacterales bacterium]
MAAQETVPSGAAIEALLHAWGGKLVQLNYDAPTGAWIIVAVHSTRAGRAGGGIRMMGYPHLPAAIEDALRLSSAMTVKFGAVGFDWGGAKTVIYASPGLAGEARQGLMRRYGDILHQLGGLVYNGPDIGTTIGDMMTIAERGSPYVFCRTPEAGGTGDPGPSTALGVFHSVKAVAHAVFGDDALAGKTVLVQGAGDVGAPLIAHLHAAGARILVSDVDTGRVARVQADHGAEPVPLAAVYDTECDLFAPCAVGGILNPETIARLRCRAVVGSANNQLRTAEDAARLQARHILYAPDFICNAGGVLGAIGGEALGWSPDEAARRIATMIPETLKEIFATAEREGQTTEAVAQRLAQTRTPVDGPDGPRQP